MGNKDLISRFLGIYNQLDAFMRKTLGADSFAEHSFLIKQMSQVNKLFALYSYELQTFAQLRNVIVHNPYRHQAHPMARPHRVIVEKYEEIKNLVFHPKKALAIAVKSADIYVTTLNANAAEVMTIMNKKSFTHVPVLEKDTMIGVFSENTIFSYLVKHKDVIVTRDFQIAEFEEFLPIDNHPNEYFEFVHRNTLVADVAIIFSKNLKKGKRIAVVFITEHGDKGEKLLGMLTPWDIAGN